MQKHRLFIAIEIPLRVKECLAKIQNKLIQSGLPLRLIDLKNLHLTLNFLGYLTNEQQKKVETILDKVAADFGASNLNLGKLCFFPNEKQFRVVALKVDDENWNLFNFQKALSAEFAKLRFIKIEKRAYKPHLTIIRAKNLRIKENEIKKIKQIKIANKQWKFTEVKLFESKLRRTGAEHEVLKSWELK
jgi:2'-5' RNA ligase